MAKRKELEPLIPLDDLKEFVAAIARVPKSAVEKAVADQDSAPQKKRNRAKKKAHS